MEPFSVASLGFGVLGGVMDFVGGFVQANKQRQLTDEYVRRMQQEHRKTVSAATAIGASSGVEFESSTLQKYLADMTAEFRAQADWARQTGYDQANSLALTGGLNAFTDFGKSAFDFAKNNNYWRQPK